ncbi:hypothetical protein M3Y98_00192000 [Aphelenchoides besseyi]|nr:hypothetical protein M3Y98_00192000 [Aphelenchoides besseyi]
MSRIIVDNYTRSFKMNQQLTSSNIRRTEKRRNTSDFSGFNRSNKVSERSVLSSKSFTSNTPIYTTDLTSSGNALLQEKENCPKPSNVETLTKFSPPDWLLRRIEDDTRTINSFRIVKEDETSGAHNDVDTDDPYADFWVEDEIDKIKLNKSAFTGYEIDERCLCCWRLGSLVSGLRLCAESYNYIIQEIRESNIKLPLDLSELPDSESAINIIFNRMQKRVSTLNKRVKGYDYSKFGIDSDEPYLQACMWCGKRSKRKSRFCNDCKKLIEEDDDL